MTQHDMELLETLDKLTETDLLSKKVTNIFAKTKQLIYQQENLNEEIETLKTTMVTILKSLIGQPIYWASPNWKMETHTIRDIEYRIVDSDFFDRKDIKYKDKKCICIEVDEDGYYLADFIGQTLFFDKNEAIQHAKKV